MGQIQRKGKSVSKDAHLEHGNKIRGDNGFEEGGWNRAQ